MSILLSNSKKAGTEPAYLPNKESTLYYHLISQEAFLPLTIASPDVQRIF